MTKLFTLTLLFVNVFAIKQANQCSESCSQITQYYNEINCLPQFNSADTCCPYRFLFIYLNLYFNIFQEIYDFHA